MLLREQEFAYADLDSDCHCIFKCAHAFSAYSASFVLYVTRVVAGSVEVSSSTQLNSTYQVDNVSI